MKRVSIHGDRTSGYTTEVDGSDVSPLLNGLQLSLGSGGQPELLLSTGAGRVDIEVDALVKFDDPAQELEAIQRFLTSVDPMALDEAMLSVDDFSTTPGQASLIVLKRLANQTYGVDGG